MQELNAQATLVEPDDLRGGATTTITRADVEEALRSDETPELVLDISGAGNEGTVAVSWQKGDLERLLREATSDRIQLTFDRATLEEALSGDVEAHSLRQKAAVLAVALTAAGAAAGGASAMNVETGVGATPAPTTSAPVATDPGTSGTDIGAASAAIAGGAAIVIAGAAFAFRSRRRLPAT